MKRNIGALSMHLESKAVLISIHPKYVDKILDGTKRVEFRRVWAAQNVTHMVIYSTSPHMKIVAIAEITKVFSASKSRLWEVAKEFGGGVTRHELREYFSGVTRGKAVLLGSIEKLNEPCELRDVFPGWRAPQSFVYLNSEQFTLIKMRLSKGSLLC